MRQACEAGADTIATACPFCMTMLDDGIKSSGKEDQLKVLDVAELALQSLKKKSS